MDEKQNTHLKYLISLNANYVGQKILTNLDPVRDIKFNAGEKIEVTEQELNQIGNHRWLIIGEEDGN